MSLAGRLLIGLAAACSAWVLVELVNAANSQTTKEICVSAEDRERVRAIVLQGIDDGLKQQATHMYEVWLQDNTEQPRRAVSGLQNGITAYIYSRAAALRWNPRPC
jgi:hypothetical protein